MYKKEKITTFCDGNLLFFYLSNAGSIGPYLISGCCSNIHCLKLLESPSVKES